MQVNDYKLEVDESGFGNLYIFRNGDKIFVEKLYIEGKNAAEVNQLVQDKLEEYHYDVVDVEHPIVEKEDLFDRKADLSLVRTNMRKILKTFGSTKYTLEQKKEMLDIYEVMCKAADVITKSCVVELTYDKFAKDIEND